MRIIDTHCHLDVAAFEQDRLEVLQRCHQLGITNIIIPGIERAGWDHLLALSAQHSTLLPALGLHPMFIAQHSNGHLDELIDYCQRHKPIAIGEIGLDFYLDGLDTTRQQHFFNEQLRIAGQLTLPVILHVRKAHDATLKALKYGFAQGGIVHAFNGSLQQAEQYIALGFKLGFGGMLTYPRSNKLRLLAQQLPLEAIVLETDAPDMVVASHRGERNSPEYIIDSLTALAALRQLSTEEVAEQTTQNAINVLRIH